MTNIYEKPTFSDVNVHFYNFLPKTCKIGMIYALLNKCFQIYSNWSMFHSQLTLLNEIFSKNGS